MGNIPFQKIDWSGIEITENKGETGTAFWQMIQFGGLRLRIVEYSVRYGADHWCRKAHMVQSLEREFVSELQNGPTFTLTKCMTYVVSDEMSSLRSVSKQEVKLLIIDGEFLKPQMQSIQFNSSYE